MCLLYGVNYYRMEKSMKNVVFIRSSAIYNDSRATKEIISLEKMGYTVYVIGWDRKGGAIEECENIFKNKNIVLNFYNEIVGTSIGLRNINKLFSFICFVKRNLEIMNDKINAVHACDLDAGIGAYQYCKKNKKPLVYDIYDYYIDSHNIPLILRKLIEFIEIKIINFSYYTVICTEQRIEQINKSKPNNVLVIHNSPDLDCQDDILEEYDYAYCGMLNDLRLIEEILLEYKNHQNLKFCFVGSGKYEELLKNMSIQFQNFTYFESLPYDQVLEIERKSKVLSAIYNPSIRNHQLCAPNKFYEALALKKPIIVCKGTGIDKIVSKYDLGELIDYDVDQFYTKLKDLIQNDERKSHGEIGRKLYESDYRWTIMEKRLIDVYTEIAHTFKV